MALPQCLAGAIGWVVVEEFFLPEVVGLGELVKVPADTGHSAQVAGVEDRKDVAGKDLEGELEDVCCSHRGCCGR